MKALTVRPGKAGSAKIDDVAEPDPAEGAALVEMVAVGVCGTDRELAAGEYGEAPPGEDRLVLGHESLGRVLEAPDAREISAGDLVAGIVRRPDPVPCSSCAVGEWDMCRNGLYTEHGIKGLHGFARERWREEPDRLVRLDPGLGLLGVLIEPTSVVAKAWEQIERIGHRAHWEPRNVLVTGAGPIGLLAALLGVQRGLEVHVLDRAAEGLKPELVGALGATYHTGSVGGAEPDADVVVECTGAPQLVADVLTHNAPSGVVCLTGVSARGRITTLDLGGINRLMVLENDVVFGSVNANRRHYEAAAAALAATDPRWLERLLTRRVPLDDAVGVLAHQRPEDIKVVLSPPGR